MTLSRRTATLEDIPFLLALRRTTMDPHLSASGASTSEDQHFKRLMYRFDCAEVLLRDQQPVGLLKVAREGLHWELIQLQLRPDQQGKGTGSQLLAELVAEADAAGATLALTVLKANPAKALYERFDFAVIGESGHGYEMQRPACGT